MALFTIPAVSKGTAAVIQLDKTELFALTPVIADAYFAVQANVDKVIVEFNSDPGNQKELLKFDMADAVPEASFQVSALARDSFLLERIILTDFDGGMLVIERSQLPSGFDITLGGGGGGGGATPQFLAGTAYPNIILSYNGQTYSKNVDVEGTFSLTEGEGVLLSSLSDETVIRYTRWRCPLDGLVPGDFLLSAADNTPNGSGIVTTTMGEWRNFLTSPISQLNVKIGGAFYDGGVIQEGFELV